ncbi:MAG: hypothetical protein ACOVN4_04125 [Bosea sp. (in: a-proteobacteria)]
MIKGLFRILAFLLLAAGFVAAVMDGARTIANSAVDYAKLGSTLFRLFGERFLLLQPAVERHVHPLLWDPVLLNLLVLPTSVVLLVLGFVSYRIGRRSGSRIGHVLRP